MKWRFQIGRVTVAATLAWTSLGADAKADGQVGGASPNVLAPARAKADPEGTWTWTYKGRDGKPVEAKIKLARAEGVLGGVAVGADGKEIALGKVSFDGDELRFEATREAAGRKFTTLYVGRIDGDRIKGKTIQGREASGTTRAWEAIRAPVQQP
jgi:hypothetical protein